MVISRPLSVNEASLSRPCVHVRVHVVCRPGRSSKLPASRRGRPFSSPSCLDSKRVSRCQGRAYSVCVCMCVDLRGCPCVCTRASMCVGGYSEDYSPSAHTEARGGGAKGCYAQSFSSYPPLPQPVGETNWEAWSGPREGRGQTCPRVSWFSCWLGHPLVMNHTPRAATRPPSFPSQKMAPQVRVAKPQSQGVLWGSPQDTICVEGPGRRPEE